MDNTTMTDEEILELAQERGLSVKAQPVRTDWTDLKVMKEDHKEKEAVLQVIAVSSLPVATDEELSELLTNVIEGATYAKEKLAKENGYRLTEDQEAMLEKAKLEHVAKINSDEGRASALAMVESASELTLHGIGRPTKSGKRAGLIPFGIKGYIGGTEK